MLQRRLGNTLAKARADAGVTQVAVGKLLRCTRGNVSLVERGQQGLTDQQLTTMLNAYGASDELRKKIFDLRESVLNAPKEWWDEYEGMFSTPAFQYWAYEDASKILRSFTGTAMPGMLQTFEYAMALANFFFADESVEYRRRFVESRLKRIGVVERGFCQMTYVMQESCLRAEVGGRDVLKAQLDRLVELSEYPNVSLRVIPNRHPMTAMSGSHFTILDYEHDDIAVYFADISQGGLLSHNAKFINEERQRYARMESSALTEEESITLIKKLALK
jgi:transcriptional regulator with XRE-family HTH domain